MSIENVYVLFPIAQFKKRSGRQEEKTTTTTEEQQQVHEISQRIDTGTE